MQVSAKPFESAEYEEPSPGPWEAQEFEILDANGALIGRADSDADDADDPALGRQMLANAELMALAWSLKHEGEHSQSVIRLTRDLIEASRRLTVQEARFLVSAYYAMQEDRIRADHRVRKMTEHSAPHEIVVWLASQRYILERQVARALDAYSGSQPLGEWARSITGIGPIIAAGLLAHIDIARAPTVGHIWRFAGLDPTTVWSAKTKRPWNADLKRLCWLIGESFVKVSGRPSDTYGRIYKERKELETKRNEEGRFADQAKAALGAKKYGEETDARKHYEAGRLPPARIHLRAKRYAVKLFLSHYHHVGYELLHGKPPPKPYIFTRPEHTHYHAPPNWNGLAKAAE